MLRRLLLAASAASLLAAPLAAANPQSLTDGLARRVEQHDDRVLDILIVSGSGQAGAFGAGYLRGWKTLAGPMAMPSFDLTLGTGTGGALAAFAYDGRGDALADAAVLYTDYVTHFASVPEEQRVLRPLRRRARAKGVDAVIDRAVLGRAESIRVSTARDDRQLIIATTDLDNGHRYAWDIGRELSVEGGENHVRDIFHAATQLPSDPHSTYVRNRGQITGTIGGDLPFVMGMADFRALGARLQAGHRGPVKVRIWALVDLWTDPVEVHVPPGNNHLVARRAAALSDLARTRPELTRLVELAQGVTAAVPGVTLETRWIAVPQDQARDRRQKPWDKDWPKRLETAGYSVAVGANPWRTDAPPETSR